MNLGVSVLENHGMFSQEYWYWLGVGALFGFSVLFNVRITLSFAYLNLIVKPQTIISEEAFEEISRPREWYSTRAN